jgi:hypothetical protein
MHRARRAQPCGPPHERPRAVPGSALRPAFRLVAMVIDGRSARKLERVPWRCLGPQLPRTPQKKLGRRGSQVQGIAAFPTFMSRR